MRVITGSARGHKLKTLEGMDIRPTTDRVKEAMFSILHFELEGARVLDLFAGSGSLGIEALSRGAKQCVFVDQSRESERVILENLKATRLAGQAHVFVTDAEQYLSGRKEHFDIALLDPPYHQGWLPRVLPLLVRHMHPEQGVILCESAWDEELPQEVEGFSIFRSYRYGKVKLTCYRPQNEEENE